MIAIVISLLIRTITQFSNVIGYQYPVLGINILGQLTCNAYVIGHYASFPRAVVVFFVK